jgi:hypothetical protein
MRSLVDGMLFAMEGQISAAEDDDSLDIVDVEQDQELTTLRRQLNLALRENLALKQQPAEQTQEDPNTMLDGPQFEQKIQSLEKQLETAAEENVVLIGQRRQVKTESLKSEPFSD